MNKSLIAVSALILHSSFSILHSAEPVPAFLFGQNLEHTRSAVQGGISAQLVKNRKFAGKPQRCGVALGWEGYGERAVFDFFAGGYTRHVPGGKGMWRQNEINSQFVSSLVEGGEAGIRQDKLALRGGVPHTFRAALRVLSGGEAWFVARLTQDGKTIGEQKFHIFAKNHADWKPVEFAFTPPKTGYGEVSIGILGKRSGVIGVVSVMANDNFHGMRRDVVKNLKDIGTSVIRWPGGNFAGEYRWRDGYLADRDQRAPIQSYTEIETHPHTWGYDSNDLCADDIIALCEEIGAKPMFTINAVFDTPEGSAEWVKRTGGKVKDWSLGNEMGYGHMEGPKNPVDYTKMVRPHAEAMLKVDPELRLTASGPYPNGGWIKDSAIPLSDLVPQVSLHNYFNLGEPAFCADGRTAQVFRRAGSEADRLIAYARNFRKVLPANIGISYDEWNIWYSWYREDGIAEGIFALKTLHHLMREWEALKITTVCYFQAVNEGAIRVLPFESRLTSQGQAMRLAKGHVGGMPVATAGGGGTPPLPVNVFATDRKDRTRYVTCFNPDPFKPLELAVPAGSCTALAGGELLVPDGLAIGNHYHSKKIEGKFAEGKFVVTLPPAAMASVLLK